ncbi:kinase-like protein [Artomyces pyxidatus]|uniref:Kinase-like protein n=1 Tax=Artomyces pyxidatus TaxID=48021 RepID=A0ACB8SNW5_9AGAM|nr:kinase-like protein [Artomyces pyxidatus]
MIPPPPPGIVFDFDGLDLSNLQSIRSPQLLNKLLIARKIGYVDYMNATLALRSSPVTTTESQSVQVLFPESSDPIISPLSVLQLLRSPIGRSSDSTASLQIHRISDSMLVKVGPYVDIAEARTMMFVRERTEIPVPTVHLVFVSEGKTYIVMDYISGGDLQHRWPTLQPAERDSVLRQVSKYLHDLRGITPPSQTPGPIGGGICRGRWFSSGGAGPFQSHAQLVAWWNKSHSAHSADREPSGNTLSADQSLVFTHCDFLPRNLILNSGTVWVVDWELAGWYPPYLEYACIAQDSGDWEYVTPEDWAAAVLPLFPDYKRESDALRRLCGSLN